MKAGEKMLISSPEELAVYISKIPKGKTISLKQMRHELAKENGADNTCPVTTGIFLRMAIEDAIGVLGVDNASIPFWRVVDEAHPLLKKLGISSSQIMQLRKQEAKKL